MMMCPSREQPAKHPLSRYHRDPERRRVQGLIDAEVRRARKEEIDDSWITYLIRDPREPDLKGNKAGTPFYVGQTKEFSKRVRSRYLKCEKDAKEGVDSVERRVADLLHLGIVAPYEVLDRQPTHLASLLSETNWARRCAARGYDMANKWRLQRDAGPPITRSDIPHDWLWSFSLEEALQDRIGLRLTCVSCREALDLPHSSFDRVEPSPETLSDLRRNRMWRTEPCTFCGERQSRVFSLVV